MSRMIIVAPSIGMVHGSFGATAPLLIDRSTAGDAFPGERLVRVPRRLVRTHRQRWLLENSMVPRSKMSA